MVVVRHETRAETLNADRSILPAFFFVHTDSATENSCRGAAVTMGADPHSVGNPTSRATLFHDPNLIVYICHFGSRLVSLGVGLKNDFKRNTTPDLLHPNLMSEICAQ